jgi:hypothetical protein
MQKTNLPAVVATIIWLSPITSFAQQSIFQPKQGEPAQEMAKSTEFAIPASPAYSFLDASSTLVTQPAVLRDLKVDWSMRSYSLAPNIALEVQPVWEILYNKTTLEKYRTATPLMRTLSTFSLSAGTFQRDTANQLAIAAKITLYREKDPIMDDDYYLGLEEEFTDQRTALNKQLKDLYAQRDTVKSFKMKKNLRTQIKQIEDNYDRLDPDQRQKLRDMRNEYLKEHWNSTQLEFAFGRIFNYQKVAPDSLKLSSQGFGLWLTGCKGFGTKWLLTGMARYSDLADIKFLNLGGSMRYGTASANLFVEALFTHNMPNTLRNVAQNSSWVFAYGGDFKLSSGVRLGFGVRNVFNKNLQFKNFIPVASVNCLMR